MRRLLAALVLVAAARAAAGGASTDPQKVAEAQELTRQVRQLAIAGRYAEALAAGRQLVRLREAIHGPSHRAVARTLLELVPVAASAGESRQASEALSRAVTIDASAVAGSTVAKLLDGLARQQLAAGQSATAIATLKLATGEARRSGKPAELAESLRSSSDVLQEAEGPAAAIPALAELLTLVEKSPGPGSLEAAATRNELGRILFDLGDLAQARLFLERSLQDYDSTLGPGSLQAAAVQQNLAHLLVLQGDLQAARPLLEQSRSICEQRLGPAHPELAKALNNLAYLLHDLGERPAAMVLFERALRIERAVPGADPAIVAAALVNDGALLTETGEAKRAEALLREALGILEAALGPGHTRVAATLSSLAMCRRAQGDRTEAKALLARSLDIRLALFGELHPDVARSRHRLAIVLLELGELEAARRESARAFEVQAGLADAVMPTLSDVERLAYVEALREYLHHFLSVHCLPGDETAAYEAVLRWKGLAWRMLVGLLASISAEAPGTRIAEELDQCRRELGLVFHREVGPSEAQAWRQAVTALTEKKERLERELARVGGSAPRALEAPRFDAVRARLPAGYCLVDYVVYQRASRESSSTVTSLAAFTATSLSPHPVRVELGPLSPIREAVDLWKRTLGSKGAPERLIDRLGSALARLVWQPIEAGLPQDEGVLVSPDGPLCQVPLEALPSGVGEFLVERREFAVLTTAGDLTQPEAVSSRRPGKGLLLVGGLGYDVGPAGVPSAAARASTTAAGGARGVEVDPWRSYHLDPLPGTREEVEALAALFRKAGFEAQDIQSLSGDRASKAAIAAGVRGKAYVHLATHGYWDQGTARCVTDARTEAGEASGSLWRIGRSPLLFAGLALSGANVSRDGVLSGEEAATLPLGGVQLVTLSACESGLGQVRSGEGVLGLRRALLAAGARFVVSALWPVPDLATQQLMARFYEHIWVGEAHPVAALAAAKREWLADARRRQESVSPVKWAGFVVTVGSW
ncbi:MAG: CHAT domain-containing protein [Candidatus Wallbacteria bacterium]|nr:CHAT domain-containing protein [Candidatus Wallbacteria bacterium]